MEVLPGFENAVINDDFVVNYQERGLRAAPDTSTRTMQPLYLASEVSRCDLAIV